MSGSSVLRLRNGDNRDTGEAMIHFAMETVVCKYLYFDLLLLCA